MTYINPIRGSMSAATLRSSVFNRSPEASAILDHNSTGRSKIFVIQMQGHVSEIENNMLTLMIPHN